jgi:hypothetical protein
MIQQHRTVLFIGIQDVVTTSASATSLQFSLIECKQSQPPENTVRPEFKGKVLAHTIATMSSG